MNTEQIHKETGKILDLENRVEVLEYRLKCLSSAKQLRAKLEIEIDGNRRGSSMEWLTVAEVQSILSSRLFDAKTELANLKLRFKN